MESIYEKAFQHNFDGICVFDHEGKGLAINQAGQRITGFTKEKFVGETTKNAIEKGYISKSITNRIIQTKKPVTDVISIQGLEVLVTGNPVLTSEGELQYVVLNVRDISELNNLKLDVLLSIALRRKHQSVTPKVSSIDVAGVHSDDVISASPKMKQVVQLAARVAKVDSSILILGESGVGKEVVVKLIHENSARADLPFIKINCAAIPRDLLESELFGYEKGAFTGANQQGKAGLFEAANGGTVFLDEIGDMPMDLQVKLLRVLQEFEIRRIGGTKDIKIDVRIVSATNKNLQELIEKGDFREDLYYRLNIIPIHIPPLRERPEDIQQLAHLVLNRTNRKYGLEHYFQPGLVELLHQYEWPGNIREMENMIERLVVTAEQDEISWSSLPFIIDQPDLSENYSLKATLEEIEKKIILEKLQTFRTTRKVAQVLGISQSAVVKKMKKYGL
ncbi:transcriptional regulator [Sporosarcina sp. P16a]|uniref:sigma-54 interaction domain-containing protein n=1 Tax=Sporosarcina TaxID=1569 RepID=UPI000A156776|nr:MULTISPECIES: sigma 54-interacting transcriptional regulator [Sporosarcina]ARJ39312.1 transcriptional regulator [Sporosarcina ureae]PIC67560.1 transcriptional regulator [Sporosarcina sp. P16a]PIC93011.1 transcriptional regulator [Sporosarcina sp. P25]